MDAAFGTETEIDVAKLEPCRRLPAATAASRGTQPEVCRQCGGSGPGLTRPRGFSPCAPPAPSAAATAR
ncbi:MAG: hypothetical protein MZV70_02975 [Desulfobacterales bacterium]|nr:hypothetical protein [Desulfobacterales bacterium]